MHDIAEKKRKDNKAKRAAIKKAEDIAKKKRNDKAKRAAKKRKAK